MSDLISRQAAIERLRAFANDDMTSTEKAISADYCVDLIRTVPTAGREWLRDLLQDAIDAGIITETQASRLMDRIAEDNT